MRQHPKKTDPQKQPAPPLDRVSYKPCQAAEAMGISVAQVYALIKEKKLKAVHLSSRLTLVSAESMRELLKGAA